MVYRLWLWQWAADKCDAPSSLQPKESIFARGLGSYMVRIGIIFAIVTIVMMEIVFISAMTLGLSLVLEDHGVYHSVWRRWVTPSRSLRYSAHTGDAFSNPFFCGSDGDFAAATGTNLWSHCVASLAPTGFHHCNWQFVLVSVPWYLSGLRAKSYLSGWFRHGDRAELLQNFCQ